jgi:hypothetical protein
MTTSVTRMSIVAGCPALELEPAAAADPWLRERLRVLPVGGRLFLD